MVSQPARDLHFSSIVVDTHSDSIGWVLDQNEDLGEDIPERQVTLPKMREGGLTAEFFAAWSDPRSFDDDVAIRRTLDFIDALHRSCADNSDQIELARTAADVRRLKAQGKLAAIACIEGGHSIEDDLGVLRMYHELGVRYMTLTWNNTNAWADGVMDDPRHDGLNDLGRDVVREMNRLGIIVDISHVSVKTFWDAMEVVEKPVMASHSGAHALCQHPRNMNDDQMRAVAENNGVVCATFVTSFVSERLRRQTEELKTDATAMDSQSGFPTLDTRDRFSIPEIVHELEMPSYTEVVDHIDHMVDVMGVDHVGLGSDLGVIPTTPVRLEDCSKFPVLTEEMLRRGYSDHDVRKILGENVLRVMEAVIGE